MKNLIDIGVNLTHSAFSKDLPDVLSRAQQAGVSKMIVTGTDIEHSQQAIHLARAYPDVLYATAGMHPHHAKEYDDQTLISLESFSQQQEVLAIGECGLDFNRNLSPANIQGKCFEAQLELASSLGLPLFLHQRDAHEKFIKILNRWRDKLAVVVAHCFTGNTEEVRAYVDLDLHIGVTGWICDERRGQSLQQAVQHIPADRLMIETDAPYLLPRDLPIKVKDRRNEPANLAYICEAIARHRNENPEQLASLTTKTSKKFFNLVD